MKAAKTPRRPPPAAPAPAPTIYPADPGGLAGEIEILRRVVRRLLATADEQEPEQAVRTLSILSATAARLARLVETQAGLPHSAGDELTAALFAALRHTLDEASGDAQE